MHSKANIKIHNRFDIEVVRDGEIIQRGQAENIVLDRIYTRLCNYSTYFTNIVYGSGTGTLDPTRTTLFTRIGSAAATTVETIKAYPVSKWTRKITLGLTTSNNQWIREVGISDDTTSINTHALITDINGDPLEIYKTELDIITIYATVFIELQNKDANNYFVSYPNSNSLLNYLVGDNAPNPLIITDASDNFENNLGHFIASATPTKTVDVPNKKVIYTRNFTTTVSNGSIKALVLDNIYKANLLKANIVSPYPYSVKFVANGLIDKFNLPLSREISDCVIKQDGVVTEDCTVESETILTTPYAPLTSWVIDNSKESPVMSYIKYTGFDGEGFRGSKTTVLHVDPNKMLNKTLISYFMTNQNNNNVTYNVYGSYDNITYSAALVSDARTGTGSRTKTTVITEPYNYLKFVLYVLNSISPQYYSEFLFSTYDVHHTVTFNTPPGLVEGEELGIADGIEDTFALANNPIITVQGDPEADPPTENEYALTVYFDGVAISASEYSLNENDITFTTPPGLASNELLGIGDGINDTFNLKFTPTNTPDIYIDGVLVDPLDYTRTGKEIVFGTEPAEGEAVTANYEYSCAITADYRYEVEITADYTVPCIPKTEDNVLDVSMEITFGETEVTP